MSVRGYHIMWACWLAVSVAWFLGWEIWGLITDRRRTLSAAVWALEDLKPGQSISGWTFAHLAFIGFLALLFVWLLGHFAFAWWR